MAWEKAVDNATRRKINKCDLGSCMGPFVSVALIQDGSTVIFFTDGVPISVQGQKPNFRSFSMSGPDCQHAPTIILPRCPLFTPLKFTYLFLRVFSLFFGGKQSSAPPFIPLSSLLPINFSYVTLFIDNSIFS
jgi:hypothetical protein